MASTNTPAQKQTPLPKSEQSKPLDPSTLREMSREALRQGEEICKKRPLPKKFIMRQRPPLQ